MGRLCWDVINLLSVGRLIGSLSELVVGHCLAAGSMAGLLGLEWFGGDPWIPPIALGRGVSSCHGASVGAQGIVGQGEVWMALDELRQPGKASGGLRTHCPSVEFIFSGLKWFPTLTSL